MGVGVGEEVVGVGLEFGSGGGWVEAGCGGVDELTRTENWAAVDVV